MLRIPRVWCDHISDNISFLLFAPDHVFLIASCEIEIQSLRGHTKPPHISHPEDIQEVPRVMSSKITRENLLLAESSLLPAFLSSSHLRAGWEGKVYLQRNSPRDVTHKGLEFDLLLTYFASLGLTER